MGWNSSFMMMLQRVKYYGVGMKLCYLSHRNLIFDLFMTYYGENKGILHMLISLKVCEERGEETLKLLIHTQAKTLPSQ
jgi:hypothetical protein